MDTQSLNEIDESILTDYAAVEDPNHGRFPRHQVDVADTNYREVNVDKLSESDFEGMKDSGLAYSDHDYIGSNPNAKVAPEISQFPVMGGVTDQYLNGETNDPCAERIDNRMSGMPNSASAMRKPQHPSALRTVKSDDYLGTNAAHHTYSQGKSAPYKDVTQPKKSGRPSKSEVRELAGDRLMGRAMVKAGMQGHHVLMQPQQLVNLQSVHPIQDNVNFRGAAPIVTPARGQKITPRGRPAIGLRRDIPDGTSAYTMVSTQQGIPSSKPISTKKTAHFGSAQAAEEAHTREMMEAAQNALAPSNATISGINAMMNVQPPLPSHLANVHPHPHHDDSIVLPSQNRPQALLHRFDEADIPRTPGKGHAYTPISSPRLAAHGRTASESHEMNIQLIHEPPRTNSDGLPVTPGGGRRTPVTSRTPRARMSISESTGSQTTSPQRSIVHTPPRPQVLLQSRPVPSSPQPSRQMVIGGHLKPSTGPSTMASAQMQMSSNAPLPSFHNQSQSMVVQRQVGESPSKRVFYDLKGAHAAPLITATGSTSYNPRRKKEKDTGDSLDAAVSRNVKAILQSDKTERLSTTRSDLSLSPRNDISDEEIIHRGRHVEEAAYESKRTASKKKGHKKVASVESSSGESDSERWEISCICGQKTDDGEEMVQCDQCILRWEHVDCIFPRTKKAPSGNYFCHVCKPRPTELTREQARAYQDRVKLEKDEAKNQELKRKLAERARRKEENSRKPSSAIRTASKASALKSEKSGNSSFREIQKNEYSTNARRLVSISRQTMSHSSGAEIVETLRNNPRIRSLIVEQNVYGIVTTEEVSEGAYIAELLGHVSLQKECASRELVPGSLNDHTFLFEKDQDKMIIDARKCGNFTKYLRRSCKPNAELEAIVYGSEMHIMIKANQRLEMHEEVSIKLEDGWKKRNRPAQGCGCDKIKQKDQCELERFFKQTQSISSSSRKSLPVNGTNPMIGRSPIRRALSEKKKVTSDKKAITKKGKKKGTIKLPLHNRKMKGGSASRGRGVVHEIDDEEEGESTMEYEESEEEKEVRGRGRKSTEGSSDSTVNERGKRDIKKKGLDEDESLTLHTPSRSTRGIRLRNDSEMKKETTLVINEDNNEKRKNKKTSESETGELKKGGRKSVVEKEIDEIKEESPSKNKTKKTRKPWPVMNYDLPSERNKVSREERKLKAECERIERESKKSGSKTRGRPPASRNTSTKEEKKGKERDEKITSSARGKRKADSEDEDGTEGISAEASTCIPPSRKRLTATEGRKRGESDASSPLPSSASLVSLTHSSLSSIVSPITEDTTHATSLPTSGKKKLLLRFQEAEKEKALALERSRVEVPSWTPTRWKKVNKEEKGEKGKMESLEAIRREKAEKGESHRQDMRRHAIHLRDTLPPSIFSIGSVEEVRVESRWTSTPSSYSTPAHPPLPSTTSVPCVSTPMENEKKKSSSVSYEEYKKRKRGEVTSGEEKKDKKERTEEVTKKSFMPRVDSSVYVPPSLPNVTLPGLDEHVGLDELKRRVYDDSPRRGGSTSSSIAAIGKSDPTPKRQSINDRLKNEFSLPMLSTPPLPPSSSSALLSASPALSTLPMSSLASEDLLTPAGGRVHKNRLSDAKAPNVGPPGLMKECPRPISLDSPSLPTSTPVLQSTTSSSFFYS